MEETLNSKKKHKCELCEYKANYSSILQRHIKQVHDKIKDFHCDKCDKSFSVKSTLQRHIKIVHDKIKDFHCDKCDYSCYSNCDLQKHIKQVHDKIKEFHCDKCKYSSCTNCDLQRHRKTCTGKQTRFSSGEFQTNKALNELGFIENEDYIFNQTFPELTKYCGKNLRPDFRLINNKIIIEYDGKQHSIPKNFGGISQEQAEDNFKQTQINDKLKDNFCKDHGYKMIRISYKDFSNILSILSNELFDIIDWNG